MSKQLPREQLVSEREREKVREGREREHWWWGGNQLLEKYCLSIPCQELVCVVAFFWASVALALWPQPPTPLSQINSTIGGLGRKLTRTTAKQKGGFEVCLSLHVCLCATELWEC